jgi:prophage tail gpP-like protein
MVSDEISIVIGGARITGWQNVSVTRSNELCPNSFVLTATDQYANDPTRATVCPKGPGEKCQIFIGSDLVITGYVEQYTITVSATQHDITIAGRGLCVDLSDCSAQIPGNTISAKNALDLATQLCKPFNLNARSAVDDLGKPIKTFTVSLGETSYEIIERVARYAGYLVYEDELGTMVLDRVGTQSMASGFAMPGNVESATTTLSASQRFSSYTVVWNTINQYAEISPLANNQAVVTDDAFIKMFPNRPRPRIIVSEQIEPGVNFAQLRANWELARRIGRSQAINLTCDSWRDSAGQLWRANMLAPIYAPGLKIVNATWIIGTVTFRKDASGTHADLTLMPPDAFNPEPSTLYLWDYEIVHAVQNQSAPPERELPYGV